MRGQYKSIKYGYIKYQKPQEPTIWTVLKIAVATLVGMYLMMQFSNWCWDRTLGI